jgi:hypothetical protein
MKSSNLTWKFWIKNGGNNMLQDKRGDYSYYRAVTARLQQKWTHKFGRSWYTWWGTILNECKCVYLSCVISELQRCCQYFLFNPCISEIHFINQGLRVHGADEERALRPWIWRQYASQECNGTSITSHSIILKRYKSSLDSRPYQIFWVAVGLERCPLSLVSINDELHERQVAASV